MRGRVVDRLGDPIDGARVQLVEDESIEHLCGADGTFELPSPPPGDKIRVSKDGLLAKELTVWPGDEPTIVLRPGVLVRGVVLDAATNRPLGGATISGGPQRAVADADGRFEIALPSVVRYFSVSHGEEYVRWIANPLLTARDRDLVVRLPRVRAAARRYLRVTDGVTGDRLESIRTTPGRVEHVDGALWLADMVHYPRGLYCRVTADGYARVAVITDDSGGRGESPTDPIKVRLPATVTLEGRVVDGDGRPVSGAAAHVRPPVVHPVWGRDIDLEAISWSGTTGEDGTFSITGPPPFHEVRLTVTHRSFASTELSLSAEAVCEPVLVELGPGNALEGLVRRADDDAPVEGARVFTEEGIIATTDAKGRFVFDRLPDEVRITVRAGGLVPVVFSKLTLPRPDPLHVSLDAGGTISGVVVDLAGNAVPHASILAGSSRLDDARDDRFPLERTRECESDAEGRFRLDRLATGTWTLEATLAPELHARSYDLETIARTGDSNVRLVARGLTGVSFRVLDRTTGDPIVRTRCFAPTGSVSYANANASSFLELRPGIPATIGVTAPGYSPELREGVVVAAGELREEEFRLRPAKDLHGVLRDRHGRPHSDATITLRPPGMGEQNYLDLTATTDADGRFIAHGVVPGAWDVVSIRLAVGGEERRLEMESPRLDLVEGETEGDLIADFPPGRASLRGYVPRLDGTVRATVIVDPPGLRAPVDDRGVFPGGARSGRAGVDLGGSATAAGAAW